jgi:hypothetical protein
MEVPVSGLIHAHVELGGLVMLVKQVRKKFKLLYLYAHIQFSVVYQYMTNP